MPVHVLPAWAGQQPLFSIRMSAAGNERLRRQGKASPGAASRGSRRARFSIRGDLVGEAAERELETLRVKSPGIPPPRLGNALRYKRPRAGGSVLPGVYAVLVPDAPTVRREPQNGAPSRIISRTVANPIRAARLRKTPQIVFVFEHDADAALVVLLPVHACILRKPLRGYRDGTRRPPCALTRLG